jgi:hypothetical protein
VYKRVVWVNYYDEEAYNVRIKNPRGPGDICLSETEENIQGVRSGGLSMNDSNNGFQGTAFQDSISRVEAKTER